MYTIPRGLAAALLLLAAFRCSILRLPGTWSAAKAADGMSSSHLCLGIGLQLPEELLACRTLVLPVPCAVSSCMRMPTLSPSCSCTRSRHQGQAACESLLHIAAPAQSCALRQGQNPWHAQARAPCPECLHRGAALVPWRLAFKRAISASKRLFHSAKVCGVTIVPWDLISASRLSSASSSAFRAAAGSTGAAPCPAEAACTPDTWLSNDHRGFQHVSLPRKVTLQPASHLSSASWAATGPK